MKLNHLLILIHFCLLDEFAQIILFDMNHRRSLLGFYNCNV